MDPGGGVLLQDRAGQADSVMPLKPSANQVAGHRFEDGRLGSLVDSEGRFYKPLQGDSRGDREVLFYEALAEANVPSDIARFFPKFSGTVDLPPVGGKGLCKHAVLEDVTHGYRQPCIIDLKIGKRTWYPGCTEEYKAKCIAKDAKTTNGVLGFRVSGLQVYQPSTGSTWRGDKKWCKSVTAADVPGVLLRFASATPEQEQPGTLETEMSLAREIYAAPGGILDQLKELERWFSHQTKFHFYSASVLVVYEGDVKLAEQSEASTTLDLGKINQGSNSSVRKPIVKLIDFAHVLHDNSEPDSNFLEGLKSLIHQIERLVPVGLTRLPLVTDTC